MKRIAVFCDGTWNSADQPHPTNVRRMAVMVPPVGADGVRQVTLYFQGVGVPEGGGWLARLNEKISGGAMGFGLDDKIATAYLHLGKQYEPGDEVHVFGFSRGAYTARSLVGLIRNCGLPHRPSVETVRACFDHYRDRGEDTRPDSEESMAFRLRVSPGLTTSAAEAAWRKSRGHVEGHPFAVTYLGVWDTVGALGIPSHWGLPARLLNRKYRFHDTDLSSLVHSARHAVAVDEMRRPFVPTLWTNLPDLRAARPGGDYRQEWFAGVHGAVGGGGDLVSLSGIALLWIANGARMAGLDLRLADLEAVHWDCDLLGPVFNQSQGKTLFQKLLGLTGKARTGPDRIAMVAHPAVGRWRCAELPADWQGRAYRPKTLSGLAGDLDGFDLAGLGDYSTTRLT